MAELGQATLKAYRAAVRGDKKVQTLAARIRAGGGTYVDADSLASITGRHAGKVISSAVMNNAVDDVITKDLAAEILQATMYDNYEYVAEMTEAVQKALNKRGKIGLNAIRPDWSQDRVDGIVEELSSAANVTTMGDVLTSQIENAAMSFVDSAVHANADFQYSVGLSPKIVRTAEAKCCEWCADLEGEYDYKDVKDTGNDIYRRHENCRCTVEYMPGDGTRQNVHSKRIYYDRDAARQRVETVKRQQES